MYIDHREKMRLESLEQNSKLLSIRNKFDPGFQQNYQSPKTLSFNLSTPGS